MKYETEKKLRSIGAAIVIILFVVGWIWLLCSPYNPFIDEDGNINPYLMPEAAQAQAIQKLAK